MELALACRPPLHLIIIKIGLHLSQNHRRFLELHRLTLQIRRRLHYPFCCLNLNYSRQEKQNVRPPGGSNPRPLD